MASARAGTVVFSARGLQKTYRMGEVDVPALRGVDLDIVAGELLVLLGPSGSGKSTLLNLLGGLDTPSAGSLRYREHDLAGADERLLTQHRRAHIGFVFQFYNLIPSLTARENVALCTELAADPMRPEEALARVGLADRLDHFPSQLSGGQQQRVAIARAFAKRPAVLLCDEPTGALDAESGKLVLGVLERVNRELGTTVVLISHNVVLGAIADRVIAVADGRVASVRENPHRQRAEELSW